MLLAVKPTFVVRPQKKRKAKLNPKKYFSILMLASCRNSKDCGIQQNDSLEEKSLIPGTRNSISWKETKCQKARLVNGTCTSRATKVQILFQEAGKSI